LFDEHLCPFSFTKRSLSIAVQLPIQDITMRSTYKMDELLKVKETAPVAVAAEIVKRIGQSEDGTRSEFGV